MSSEERREKASTNIKRYNSKYKLMVLVTGGAGLVGNELISQLLTRGREIRALYNKSPLLQIHPRIEPVNCSVLDVIGLEQVMDGIEEVYHCAGYVSFTSGNEEELYKINVEGTANVVNACIDAGIRKLVHVSSVAALGRLKRGEFITEDIQWTMSRNVSKYSKSKYLGELEVWRGIAEGLNAVIVNPSIILGAGNWKEGSTQLFRSVYNEFPWYTDGVRGFVDVRDVADAMIRLMESEIAGERFILNAANAPFKELFDKIAVSFNKKPPVRKASPLLASFVWRLQGLKALITGKKALLTKETSANAFSKEYYDNTKLIRYLPSFAYRTIEETISHTCNSLQQKLNNQ